MDAADGGEAADDAAPAQGRSGAVTVENGATLGGSGIVGGATTFKSGSTHTPGASPEIQEFTNGLTYEAGSTVVWELIGNTESGPGTNFDRIMVGNGLNFNGSTTLNLTFNSTGSAVKWSDDFWDLYTIREWQIWGVYSGATSGFNNLNFESGAESNWLDTSDTPLSFAAAKTANVLPSTATFYLFKSGESIYLRYEALPEPATFGLLGLVLASLAVGVRRRRHLGVVESVTG